jgi:carboxyl-terminal processing protease
VTTKGKVKDWDRSFKTLNKPVDQEIPVIVLINNNSASASEIVSGVLQDYDRAVLIGQRSYGKGLVQNTRDIGYNSKVKMTTAKYYIPSGRCIQSVEYENGEPVDISDTKRAKFTTRAGRTVLDGGGVRPDILIDKDGDSEILATLRNKYILFKYVTEYTAGKDTLQISENFDFSEWDNFVSYLEKINFDYDTKSEDLLKELKNRAKKDGYLSNTDIAALEQKIIQAKKSDLEKHKEEIIGMIEKEVVGRFYFQRGQIKTSLRNDAEIKEAVKLFNDKALFKKALAGK